MMKISTTRQVHGYDDLFINQTGSYIIYQKQRLYYKIRRTKSNLNKYKYVMINDVKHDLHVLIYLAWVGEPNRKIFFADGNSLNTDYRNLQPHKVPMHILMALDDQLREVPTHPGVFVNKNGTVVMQDWFDCPIRNRDSKAPNRGKRVSVLVKNKCLQINVHILVALAWVKNRNNDKIVLHLDCNANNNYYKNITWGTKREQIINQFINNKFALRDYQGNKFEISEETKQEIRSVYEKGWSHGKIRKHYHIGSIRLKDVLKNGLKK